MARTRIGFGKKRRKTLFHGGSRPWGDMDSNLLAHIFSWLPTEALFFTVFFVCRCWRSTFWEVCFWRDDHTLDLTRLKSLVRGSFSFLCPWKNRSEYRETLLNLMECLLMDPHVLGNTQRCVTSIIVPRNMYISGCEDMAFISKRTPCLKRLSLQDAYGLEDGCFSEALKNWKSLEKILIGPAYDHHVVHIIQELGMNCMNLQTLGLSIIRFWDNRFFKLDLNNAKLIANHLPQLKEFSMAGGDVDKDGLSVILYECQRLLALSIESCRVLPTEIYTISLNIERTSKCTKWRVNGSRTSVFTSDEILSEMPF